MDEGDDAFPSLEVEAQDPSIRAPAMPSWRDRARVRLDGWAPMLRRVGTVTSVVAVLGGSVVGGRAAHHWMTRTPRFGAHTLEVNGITHTTRDEVLGAAGVHEGTNVLGLDTRHAEQAIEQLPWVARARVTRRLPDVVHVEVEERTPVAVVSAGGLYLCADDGTLFKRAQPGDPDDLPVVTGIDRAEFERDADMARENVRDALALLADVSASSLGARIHVSEVHRDATGDLALVLVEGGTYVWLGRGPYRAKLSRLSSILAELERGHYTAAEIHLESDRHADRATVRLPVAPGTVFAVTPSPAREVLPAPVPSIEVASEREAPTVVIERHRGHRRR